MKRLGWIVAVLVLALALSRPATGQDNHEGRIRLLETRVALLEATAAGTTAPIPSPVAQGDLAITAVVRITGRDYSIVDTGDGGCEGDVDFSYRGLRAGASLRVLDERDDQIGTATIERTVLSTFADVLTCELHIRADGLPKRNLYRLQMLDLGEIIKTYEELEANDWTFDVTV